MSHPDINPPSNSSSAVVLRPATGLLTGLIPPEFLFLHSLSPPQAYRIHFRHPAYNDNNNVLLSLHAWDRVDGGIQYGLAHTACAIVANNRFDGYLSESHDPLAAPIELAWNDLLPNNHHGYYFHVRNGHDDLPPANLSTIPSPPPTPPYRWPIVPSFQDWKFPHNRLPPAWQNCAGAQCDSINSAQSDQSGAVHRRDLVCRMSAHSTGTEAAHLVPAHERLWFETNGMGAYNNNTTLDAAHLLHDANNALLLRSDLHKAFDDRKFCFFPKGDDNRFIVHVLQTAPDLRLLYHNTSIAIPECEVNYIFARFAWSIFPLLASFLTARQKSRLVVQWDEMQGDWIESEVPAHVLARKSVASRSNSPTKRSRTASSAGEEEQQSRGRQCSRRLKRNMEPFDDDDARPRKTRRCLSSNCGTLSPTRIGASEPPDLTEDELPEISPTQSFDVAPPPADSARSSIQRQQGPTSEHFRPLTNCERLRQEALARQRPPDYIPPSYKEDGDLKEQLEFMGVEIIDDPD